jgi:hypothetical protein
MQSSLLGSAGFVAVLPSLDCVPNGLRAFASQFIISDAKTRVILSYVSLVPVKIVRLAIQLRRRRIERVRYLLMPPFLNEIKKKNATVAIVLLQILRLFRVGA